MMEEQGFKIEVKSRYDEWWRYNADLMCGCFDIDDNRIGFASAASDVADVGSNLTERPTDIPAARSVVLTTPPCHHLVLYVYIIPHTLPAGNDIDSTRPFEAEIRISRGGKLLRSEKRSINQWSGASIELRVDSHE